MTRGLFALYREDPDKADRLLFGRVTHPDRRGFLKNAGLATMGALVGATIPFHRNIPAHFIPVSLADAAVIEGKDGLVVLNDRPLSAETPAHLLDDAITPTERHFIRNNGIPPAGVDEAAWRLTVDGLVETPLTLGIDDLKRNASMSSPARSRWNVPATAALSSTRRQRRRAVDLRRRRLRGMDRRPPRRRAQGRGREERRGLHRARGRGHAPLRRSGSGARSRAACRSPRPWTRRASSPSPRTARPIHPYERRAAPPGLSGLARIVLAEMAHPYLAAGTGSTTGRR